MGGCSSCLGLRRKDSQGDENETSRLLSDDPYRAGYGSRLAAQGGAQRQAYQPDPESVRREREALDGICHSMSDNVIDVFTAQTESRPHAAAASHGDSLQFPPSSNGGNLTPDEVRLRTIKKGRGGPIFSSLKKTSSGIRAVQDAIG